MPFEIGDEVYVPRTRLGLDPNAPSPFYRTTIREREKRSVRVDLPGGQLSELVATKSISDSFGVLILRIGDFREHELLDPLAQSIFNYSSMLLPGDSVRLVQIRTIREFILIWREQHGTCKQLIIIGHGYEGGLMFGDKEVSVRRFRRMLEEPDPSPKEVISLACNTGYTKMGRGVSQSPAVSHFVAPFQSVHGCVASVFASTFLHERLLAHHSARVAYKHAKKDLVGGAKFRLFENGAQFKEAN